MTKKERTIKACKKTIEKFRNPEGQIFLDSSSDNFSARFEEVGKKFQIETRIELFVVNMPKINHMEFLPECIKEFLEIPYFGCEIRMTSCFPRSFWYVLYETNDSVFKENAKRGEHRKYFGVAQRDLISALLEALKLKGEKVGDVKEIK